MELQEIISRARFILSGAPKRYDIFNLINGKNSTKDISKKTGRSLSSVLHDIKKLRDLELIREKLEKNGILKKAAATVYEKVPLVRHVPNSYFKDIANMTKLVKKPTNRIIRTSKRSPIRTPSENEILDICKDGEDQLYEFKSPGIKMEAITEEIAAYLHTKDGGIIFYGIDDGGTIIGADINRQEFDQRIQNSIRNTVSPAPNVIIKDKNVMGIKIILIIIFPWDKKSLYQYTKKGKYLIRKGTNKFALDSNEIKNLTRGEYIC